MHSGIKTLLATAAVCAMTASYTVPAFADGKSRGVGNQCQGNSCGGLGGTVAVPGPLAGAGLPFLLLAGGYALMRRYRNRHTAE
jgi:hypothetical protein